MPYEQTTGLTKTILTEDQVFMGKPMTKMIEHNLNVYQPLLTREYLLEQRVINISGNREARNSYSVVKELRRQVALQKILSLYQFYRFSGVKVKILVKSLPQQYGFAWITRCAYYNSSQTNDSGDDLWISKDPIVLSLNEQNAAVFELPNVSLRNWFMTQDSTLGGGTNSDDGEDLMWAVNVSNEATYKTDASVASTYEVWIFASFINPEVAGPVDPTYVPPPALKTTKKKKVVQGQSDSKNLYGSMMAFGMGTAVISGAATRNANIENVSQEIRKQEPGDVADPSVGSGPTGSKDPEMPVTCVQQNPWGSLAQPGEGGCGVNIDFVPAVSRPISGAYGDPNTKHYIRDMIRRPQLELVSLLTAVSEPIQLEIHPGDYFLTGSQESIGYMAWFSQFFRRWRGSIKVMIMFTTSSFISARVYVKVAWGRGIAPNGFGDFHTDVLTIKGNVNHTLIIPYLYPEPWKIITDGAQEETRPIVEISLDSISSAGDETPGVVTMIWFAAGDDFVYDSYQYAGVTGLPASVQAQTDVTALFGTQFDLVTGFSPARDAQFSVAVEELLERWSGRWQAANYSSSRVYAYSGGSGNIPDHIQNWDFFCNMFLYNSGAVRRKYSWTVAREDDVNSLLGLVTLPSTNPLHQFADDSNNPNNGVALTTISLAPIIDVVVPFIANFEVDENPEWIHSGYFGPAIQFSQIVKTMGLGISLSYLSTSMIKAGPNFSLHFLQPLAARTQWPWSRTGTQVSKTSKSNAKK